ncbi:small GTPase superfamily [Jimgerdemannia flammicorona]|uniref:GTP-binding protein RHO3 n=1 Tax=Jimgerdemannia flammicorona TaxID=994334 RepID=A0A433DK42_9FUNG|nr:small GTPase superfamily [Jimgerdemannia flammicorona]
MSLCATDKPIFRKLVVLGDGGCGKTSLLNVFTRKYFPQVYEPTIFENYVYDFTLDGQEISLSLWDTAGQEEFGRLRTLSYADTHVIMLCFSVDSRDSLENIGNKWIEEVAEHCPNVKIMLTALKCDLRDDEPTKLKLARVNDTPLTYEEGLACARSINAVRYLECSAKHNRGVTECFEQAARLALTGMHAN